ncbi:MAG: CopG family transcriptional regulator [Candidatus Limnocylindria bacterium]
MLRKQIYLDESLDRRLRTAAASEGRSAASLIRDAVRGYLDRRAADEDDPFRRIVGAFNFEPADSSLEHDRYLYREDR